MFEQVQAWCGNGVSAEPVYQNGRPVVEGKRKLAHGTRPSPVVGTTIEVNPMMAHCLVREWNPTK